MDIDGSNPDLGAFGSKAGALFDLDADGLLDYSWPGAYEDAPAFVDPASFDCDDRDPTVSCSQARR